MGFASDDVVTLSTNEAFLKIIAEHTAGSPTNEQLKWRNLTRQEIAQQNCAPSTITVKLEHSGRWSVSVRVNETKDLKPFASDQTNWH